KSSSPIVQWSKSPIVQMANTAHRCMNADPNQRPAADELYDIFNFWYYSTKDERHQEKENFGYKGKEIVAIFEEADKEIPNISISYDKDPDTIYSSRLFIFRNLPKPVNSSIITTSYLNEEENNEGTVFKIIK